MNFLTWLLGGSTSAIAKTAEVFRENAEAGAQRQADFSQAALAQYASEFQHQRRGFFDRFMDGLNRLPRPVLMLATLALFASAMFDPIWFAERMQGLALVPEPLWWLAGVIVSFYFGGRFQVKSQDFQRSVVESTAMVPKVIENIQRIRALRADSPGVADTGTDTGLAAEATASSDNPALAEWQKGRHG